MVHRQVTNSNSFNKARAFTPVAKTLHNSKITSRTTMSYSNLKNSCAFVNNQNNFKLNS